VIFFEFLVDFAQFLEVFDPDLLFVHFFGESEVLLR
jgi:hypothetical protein